MNSEYISLVGKIINNRKFKKLKLEKHHNTNRYDHSIRVSYLSYKLCKKLNLDYVSVARAGLLHDYYFSSDFKNMKGELRNHYKKALINSKKLSNLSIKEENIITSHMYPVGGELPKYIESVIVNLVDDYVSVKENIFGFKLLTFVLAPLVIFGNMFLIFSSLLLSKLIFVSYKYNIEISLYELEYNFFAKAAVVIFGFLNLMN